MTNKASASDPNAVPSAPSAAERLEAAQKRRENRKKTEEEAALLVEAEVEETLDASEAKCGTAAVCRVDTVSGPFVLHRQPGIAWDNWQKAVVRAGKGEIPQKAIDNFLHPSIDYPPDFKHRIEETPAIQADLVIALSHLYGAKAAEDLGKQSASA